MSFILKSMTLTFIIFPAGYFLLVLIYSLLATAMYTQYIYTYVYMYQRQQPRLLMNSRNCNHEVVVFAWDAYKIKPDMRIVIRK